MTTFSPRRPLGRTGFTATRLGAGDVADRNVPIDRCVATLARALDAGINVVDTAPAYEDSFPNEQDAAFAAAAASEPLTAEGLADVRRRAEAAIRGKGPCWWNPTSPV